MCIRDSLTTGVRQLNTELRRTDALAMHNDTLERILAGVGINPEAAMGDTAMAFDMGGFEHQQARAGVRKHAEMGHVPVVADAVIG